MRSAKRLALCLSLSAVSLLAGGTAFAADPVGTWAIDQDAFRRELQRVMQAELARMPPAERVQIEPSIMAHIDEMARRSTGMVEFRADGTVLADDTEGDPRTGHWTLNGDRIRLVPDGDPALVGTLEGDTMRLREEEAEPTMEIVLKRR